MEQLLHSVWIRLFPSIGVTSWSLKLLDLSFNELVYDFRVILFVSLFLINHSAVLLKNLLSFSGSTFSVFGLVLRIHCMTFHISFVFWLKHFVKTCLFLAGNLFDFVFYFSELFLNFAFNCSEIIERLQLVFFYTKKVEKIHAITSTKTNDRIVDILQTRLLIDNNLFIDLPHYHIKPLLKLQKACAGFMLNKYAMCEDITKLKRLLVPERIILPSQNLFSNVY